MGTFVFTDAFVSINSVDLSDHVQSVELPQEVEEQDDTAMGDTTRSRAGGLKDWSLTVNFLQDFAASKVDASLNALVGTVVAIEIRPTSAAVGSTNPKWTGSGLVKSYGAIGGSVGDMAVAPFEMVAAGDLTRAVA